MGVGSVFFWPAPVLLKQGYLVVTGVVTAYMFTFIPEWTTWTLLIAMALYDLYAVLTPGGPLKVALLHHAPASQTCADIRQHQLAPICTPSLATDSKSLYDFVQVLVELAIERDQDIPALIYEGRSTVRSLSEHAKVSKGHTAVLS